MSPKLLSDAKGSLVNGRLILENIISTKILDEYRLNDPDLDRLIKRLTKSINQWQSLKDIYVSDKTGLASKIEPAFQRRLQTIPDEKQLSNSDEQMQINQLRISLERFLKYLKSHPYVEITFAVFNCNKYSYDVHCGIIDQEVDVICVMKGGHIPEDLLAI